MGLGGGGRVSALRARDGTKIWSATIGGASPDVVVANEVVGTFPTPSPASPRPAAARWSRFAGTPARGNGASPRSRKAFDGAAVTVDGHTAYVYGGDGKLYALRS